MAIRLLYGSPLVTVDLVTADSKQGSDPKVVGNLGSSEFIPRTAAGEVSDSRTSRHPDY